MNQSLKPFPHYLALAGVIALGAILRFLNLDLKPLWLDEVITAIFSLGHNYQDVPLDVAFPLSALGPIFSLKPAVSCSEIAHNIATQSTHPPLFFCWMHSWLAEISTFSQSWVWKLRSLPALFGVAAILAVYWLNRLAFSPSAGLMASAVMAVSPFGVYLSQEARHYTLPVLLITLALVGLIQIQQDIYFRQKLRPLVLLGWVVVNSIGFYVHYFFILTFIAQIVTLIIWFCTDHSILQKTSFFQIFAFCIFPVALFSPWMPMVFGHFGRPETNWIPQPHNIAPLYQTLAGWLLMVVSFPTENQPLWIAVPAGLLMLLFGVWLGRNVWKGFYQLSAPVKIQLSIFTLGTFLFCVLLEYLVIVYALGKDITIAPRYNFVYHPIICAFIGAGLVQEFTIKNIKLKIRKSWIFKYKFLTPKVLLVVVGILSCLFVVSNLAFQKPYNPQQVAQQMNLNSAEPLMVVVGYNNSQDVALGLSFALALDKVRKPVVQGLNQASSQQPENTNFAFLQTTGGYDAVWQHLSQMQTSLTLPLNLWVVAPGLKRINFPPQLALVNQTSCNIDPKHYHRLGIPYQMYRCE